VVGAGLAGAKTVEALRAEGFDGRLVLVGAEAHLPYERPPLSKGYLAGTSPRHKAFVHPDEWYSEHDVELHVATSVVELAADQHEVVLSDGARLRYDRLALTTGSRPRRLTLPGADLPAVAYLRDLDDSDRIKSSLRSGARIVIIGGGWIGLEVASAARGCGAEVTVLEGAALPLLRVLGQEVATAFADLHRGHGVDLRCGVSIVGLEPAGAGAVVSLADGTRIAADLVVVGVGILPNSELAGSAGLDVDNGVLADAHLRTSDPDVVVAGDVANAFHPLLARRLRVEHWANAMHQPAVAAATMLGRDASYDRLPYFFSDQYDVGMEYFGYADPAEADAVVLRGDPQSQEYAAFWVRAGRLLAGMHVNRWDDADAIKALPRISSDCVTLSPT
jgi:3-phenylpropionate/trans-cinnamate dioxygenase ferredoxin reductase component